MKIPRTPLWQVMMRYRQLARDRLVVQLRMAQRTGDLFSESDAAHELREFDARTEELRLQEGGEEIE